jgi:hypothetical protein
MSSISTTLWERFEPRPRADDQGDSLASPISDPLWFLTRQWQVGEFEGRDAGSLAFADYFGSQSGLPRFVVRGSITATDPGTPLERQTLSEPFEPDLSLRVELGQLFRVLLAGQVPDPSARTRILSALLAMFGLVGPVATELNPVDPGTQRFLTLCAGRSVDGVALYQLAQTLASGGPFPGGIAANPTEQGQISEALAALFAQVQLTYGSLGSSDPQAWISTRLEYQVQVVAADPGGVGNATLNATPNSQGEFDWYSMDVVAKNPTATEAPPTPVVKTTIPSSARFPSMPNPRFWYIEENSLSHSDVQLDPTDVVKLLVTDMMIVHGGDWFLFPLDQPLGTAMMTNGIVVTDVFGHRSLVQAANRPSQPVGLDRWAMFAHTDDSAGRQQLTNYFVVPPSPLSLAQDGATVEDVRFARDEVADMGWAIERTTESPIGEPRSGRERDAEIDANQKLPAPPPGDPSAALLYQIESRVPANWTPLLGVQPDPTDPSIQLEKAAMLHPTTTGVDVVPSLGRFLSPSDVPTGALYRIVAEEVPRDGLRLLRVISRSRWVDGTTHLWVSRRRSLGAGEAQSGLRFDSALPNQT